LGSTSHSTHNRVILETRFLKESRERIKEIREGVSRGQNAISFHFKAVGTNGHKVVWLFPSGPFIEASDKFEQDWCCLTPEELSRLGLCCI